MCVEFWKKLYLNTSKIKFDNKTKWLQYQVNRNSLYTNARVSKFNANVSNLCTFCGLYPELISHLFYDCSKVYDLICELKEWVASLEISFSFTKKQVIFGNIDESPGSVINFILLCLKNYIWKAKFTGYGLSLRNFQYQLLSGLKRHKEALKYTNNESLFDQWSNIFNNLSGLPTCSDQNQASMPHEAPDQTGTG